MGKPATLRTSYESFLESKMPQQRDAGIPAPDLSSVLFDFQADATRWALRKGRAGVFLDTGLGKTPVQLEWARAVAEQGPVLIVAPLSVADQTTRMAKTLGLVKPTYVRSPDAVDGVCITNYEHAAKFIGVPLAGLVLDESSRLAAEDSKTRALMVEQFADVPMRLSCTATPIPNDVVEISNQAHFLGVMTRSDVLATFFVHDDEGWRLRGHAREPFFRWLASWALAMRSPADLGYDGARFALPSLEVREHLVESGWKPDDRLFHDRLRGVGDRARVRKSTASVRASVVAGLAQSSGPCIVWCDLNAESALVAKHLGSDAVEVCGSDPIEAKREKLIAFLDGEIRVLVTKPKIAGFGMNFQHAAHMVFCGLSDSWQSWYQAIRRCWRFGQTQPVRVDVVISDAERQVLDNVRRKEAESESLVAGMVEAMRDHEMRELGRSQLRAVPLADVVTEGDGWEVRVGDCVDELQKIKSGSVGLTVSSPPFLALYAYTDSERDLGNSQEPSQYFEHFRFVAEGLLRVTAPGRLACLHVAQVSATLNGDGFIGVKDFRAGVVASMVAAGWVYYGEVTVDKNPQAQAIRTHSKALLFVQLAKDSSWVRPALADYVLIFRKPGDGIGVTTDVDNETWIEWASPIWRGIRESDTLNAAEARGDQDDRHVCPLQLDLIERCIRLWSNRGDVVFDPFAGIGSTGYVAIRQGRRFLGTELKPLYASASVRNLKRAERENSQGTLFEEPHNRRRPVETVRVTGETL